MAILLIPNGPMQTTSSFATVATGTALKTMLQVKASATKPFKIKRWGFSLDGFAAALPGKVELFESDVAATVTASVAADITKIDGEALACGDVTTNLIQVGTAATGYTASVEGTTTVARNFDLVLAPPTGPYVFQWPLGQEPIVQISKFLRIRVLFGTTVNMYCFVEIEI